MEIPSGQYRPLKSARDGLVTMAGTKTNESIQTEHH